MTRSIHRRACTADADFLRNPKDPCDAPFHPKVPNDEFVLKYQKPM